MGRVGVRELKEQASEIIRSVRDDGELIDVTYRGRVVARISPAEPPNGQIDRSEFWARLEAFSQEVGDAWEGPHSAIDAIREDRR